MDDYTSAREALEDLTKGTEEYNAALEEANRAALELMQNHPEYFGEGSYKWEEGQLILDEAAMENAKTAEREKVSTAYAAKTMAEAGAQAA
jgi:hypothetical protein